jgi:hypothetical protein
MGKVRYVLALTLIPRGQMAHHSAVPGKCRKRIHPVAILRKCCLRRSRHDQLPSGSPTEGGPFGQRVVLRFVLE